MIQKRYTRYIGIPFDSGGGDLSGTNCWGLHQIILRECAGIEVPTYESMYRDSKDAPGIKSAVRSAEESGRWIRNLDEPEELDLVLLRVRGFPWHIGTYVGDKFMINANEGAASCLERVDSVKWKGSILGYWKYV